VLPLHAKRVVKPLREEVAPGTEWPPDSPALPKNRGASGPRRRPRLEPGRVRSGGALTPG
jgi:hypothetical protein